MAKIIVPYILTLDFWTANWTTKDSAPNFTFTYTLSPDVKDGSICVIYARCKDYVKMYTNIEDPLKAVDDGVVNLECPRLR